MGNVTRRRVYENDAARQRAYRERLQQRQVLRLKTLYRVAEVLAGGDRAAALVRIEALIYLWRKAEEGRG